MCSSFAINSFALTLTTQPLVWIDSWWNVCTISRTITISFLKEALCGLLVRRIFRELQFSLFRKVPRWPNFRSLRVSKEVMPSSNFWLPHYLHIITTEEILRDCSFCFEFQAKYHSCLWYFYLTYIADVWRGNVNIGNWVLNWVLHFGRSPLPSWSLTHQPQFCPTTQLANTKKHTKGEFLIPPFPDIARMTIIGSLADSKVLKNWNTSKSQNLKSDLLANSPET